MGWTPDDIPVQEGRVAVVTGANSGLGLETALALARAGAHVVMAARNEQKAAAARGRIAKAVPTASLEVRSLDLASLDSITACAEGILADHPRVDLLVNNAGVMALPEQTTEDGFELQLGVNHLGHFAFTRLLLPAVLAAPRGRIVSVTSFGRLVGRTVSADDPHLRGRYGPWRAYNRSKLANLHFAVELHRQLTRAGSGVVSVAAHPGLSHTDLQPRSVRETGGGLVQRVWDLTARVVGMPAEQAAWSLLRAATEPRARGGRLYGPRLVVFGAPVRRLVLTRLRAPKAPARLWRVSERENGERFDVAAIVRSARSRR